MGTERGGDDDAWQAIVDNFGDRAELGPDEPDAGRRPDDPLPTAPRPAPDEDDAFVPPPPPPVPTTTPDRMAAWAGVFGAPAILLACLVLGLPLPPLLGYLLVAAFVGGFLYLVFLMPRGPRDPWDDGAVL